MCGLTGAWKPGHDMQRVVESASQCLCHRGPDHQGIWSDPDAGVAIGHRRLAVVELSPAGNQPMISASGRLVLAYNGEIYNHDELRARLSGVPWRGHSDTETLLAAVEAWGVEQTLRAAIGMFAMAIWDRQTRRLVLARDRFGEKPLYYGHGAAGLVFASELKALRSMPRFEPQIDRGALDAYMQRGYVPEGQCIYRGVAKLTPGTWIDIHEENARSGVLPRPAAYWSAARVAVAATASARERPDGEVIDELEQVLGDAVAGQLMSDVPLGAFLSGGIDSSTVVALMRARTTAPVRTFTIGFAEAAFDEAAYARAIAAHLHTEHTELYVTPADAQSVIPRLPAIYDEPFADSSQIPTFLVAQLARRSVTVSLSGDGGDELFGGYNRYVLAARQWRRLARVPRPVRELAGTAVQALSPASWDRIDGTLQPMLPSEYHMRHPGEKLHKAADGLRSRDGRDLYQRLTTFWQPGEIVRGAAAAGPGDDWTDLPDLVSQMMARDTVTYLPGDILTKVDRAAMAVSLETRLPMLDHRVFAFAWGLPLPVKIRDGVSKWPLRELLSRHVPGALFERPKSGFSVPIDAWLRGPLRPWAEALLDPDRIAAQGYLDPAPIARRWREHLSGDRNWQQLLWNVLMFNAWLDANA